jgi:glycosyltransferase involved in cell wall biosynthesis
MKNNVLVSIIVPAYNCEKFIEDSIKSALTQTYSNLEVIVVNNSEKERIINQIVSTFKDPRLSMIHCSNEGAAHARNKGIEIAQGNYIYFLDGDDIIKPEAIDSHVKNNDGSKVTYSDYRLFEDNDPTNLYNTDFKRNNYSGDVLEKLIDEGNFIAMDSALIPKQAIIDAGMIRGETLIDWDLWLRLSINGYKFSYIDKVLLLVRKVPGSLSSDKHKMAGNRLKCLESIEPLVNDIALKKLLNVKIGNATLVYLLHSSSRERRKESGKAVKMAMTAYFKAGFVMFIKNIANFISYTTKTG